MNHKIQLNTIDNLDDRNGSLKYIKGKFNRKDILFLLDTGATRTCVNQDFIDNFLSRKEKKEIKDGADIMGLGTSNHKSQEYIIKKINFNRLKLHDFPVVITDLESIFSALELASDIKLHGIIGNDFLIAHHAVIDFGKNILKLKS